MQGLVLIFKPLNLSQLELVLPQDWVLTFASVFAFKLYGRLLKILGVRRDLSFLKTVI